MKFKAYLFKQCLAVISFVSAMIVMANIAVASGYQAINADELSKLISQDQRVKLVFLFTSWCPYCKIGYEKAINITEKYSPKKLLVLPISIDEKTSDLDDFLIKHAKVNAIPVNYRLHGGSAEIQKLSALGINFGGSIPYIALLDEKNKVIVDGRFDEKYLEVLIAQLMKNK